jgi:hypothetical protein
VLGGEGSLNCCNLVSHKILGRDNPKRQFDRGICPGANAGTQHIAALIIGLRGRKRQDSRARRIAGLSGFLTLIQSRDAVGRGQPLRHDTFEAHFAGVPKHHGAILLGVLVEDDPGRRPRQ